ncbi:MAG: chromosomal replication initiator protein DnaA [Oxalobacter formigenes]|nr:chromosomal replication initiator protein DnaA [Oxalobacter formigenes]
MRNFWQSCLNQMELELPPQQYQAWIKPLTPLGYENGVLRIAAPNRFKMDMAKKEFSARFADLASQYWDMPVAIQFSIAAASPEKPVISPAARLPRPAAVPEAPQHDNGIDPDMTFGRFVTGKANQLARAAALQVASNPGVSYNPLFIYGGVGLGKTHLIHAIGNQVMQERPGARIRYIHAEQYIRNVTTAYQRNSWDDFKRYYHSLDILLIDDIQFFAAGKKNRTQEEFFYAFEALTAARKQIIITSDTYPKEIDGLEARLVSRFNSGLTVAIEPPELEMRVAILLKKAGLEGICLADDAAFFVATHFRSNVRELEGALRNILAYSRFQNTRDVTVNVVKEALRDKLAAEKRLISVENIQKTVADFYRIKVADMYSRRRPANIARPRQIAMYLTKELTQKSLPEIGELFGGRDHTTVLHAVRKITQEKTANPECARELRILEETLKG